MTRPASIALLGLAIFVAGCGGSSPPEQAPPAQTPAASPPPTSPADSNATPEIPPPPSTAGSASTPSPAPPAAAAKPIAPERPAFTRTDLNVGTGALAQKGRGLSVNYTGWLYDPTKPDLKGRMFDTSKDRGPFTFVLGAGQVIPGWDQGFDGMKVGGRRRLTIPPDLAYGDDGAGDGIIPPKSVLIFEMELLGVQ
jgi:FKBP-type peptidyl-prolyl cis-trans isomerase FkpA